MSIKKRVAIYARSATTNQAQVNESLERQRQICQVYLGKLQEPMQIVEFAETGIKSKCAVNQFRKMIKTIKISDLIVADISRLSRSIGEVAKTLESMKKNNIKIHVVSVKERGNND